MMMLLQVLFFGLLGSCFGFLYDINVRQWTGLKVAWGPKLDDPNYFVSMPRTTEAAVQQGFKKISDCDAKASWRGARYVKDKDYALVLLYDVKGYIAGIQTTVPSSSSSDYPSSGIQPPFVRDGDNHLLTAYFVDPTIICTTGRSESDFLDDGTGTNLYIQNGTNAESDSIMIPKKQSGMASTKWSKGKCVPTMGVHYWYNPIPGMDCNNFFPMFPIYNDGVLTGFGWVIATKMTTKHLDHQFIAPLPPSASMNTVTKCLTGFPILSSMHIFLNPDISLNKC